jgi:hypothetical protein
MNINISVVENLPNLTCEIPMMDKRLALLRETKKATVRWNFDSKTLISLSFQWGLTYICANNPIAGFEQKKQSTYWWVFKKSKKQDFECFKRYVAEQFKNLMAMNGVNDLDEVTLEMEQW